MSRKPGGKTRRKQKQKPNAGKSSGQAGTGGDPLSQAEAALRDGRPAEASRILDGLQGRDPRKADLRHRIRDRELRKLQRQNKAEAFARLAGDSPDLALAAARIAGEEALASLAASDAPAAALAQAAMAPEARAALKILHRAVDSADEPALRPLSEGWMLVLRGEYDRADERFAACAAAAPRRTQLGQSVARALAGRSEEARRLWQQIGPFHATATPMASAFGRWLDRAAIQTGHGLQDLFTRGDAAAVNRALENCPKGQKELRAWLLLRAGDHHFAAEDLPSARQRYNQAKSCHPAVMTDVLKRLVHCEIAAEQPPQSLIVLHRHLAKQDRDQARRAVDSLGPLIPDALLDELEHPRYLPKTKPPSPKTPPEWLRIWLRRALWRPQLPFGILAMMGRRPTGLPPQIRKLDPLLERLDKAYGDTDSAYLRQKLALFERYDNHSRLRKTCFRLLTLDPTLADEFIWPYIKHARLDRRGRQKILGELEQLESRFPRAFELYLLHGNLSDETAPIYTRLETALGTPAVAFLRWANGEVPEFPIACVGKDPAIDTQVVVYWKQIDAQAGTSCAHVIATLSADPVYCRRTCERAYRQTGWRSYLAFLSRWYHAAQAWQSAFLALCCITDVPDMTMAEDRWTHLHVGFDKDWRDLFAQVLRQTDPESPEHQRILGLQEPLEFLEYEVLREQDCPLRALGDIERDIRIGDSFGMVVPEGPDPMVFAPDDLSPLRVVPHHAATLDPESRDLLETVLTDLCLLPEHPTPRSVIRFAAGLDARRRDLLADFTNAVITEATMFDPLVQEDPLLRGIVATPPQDIRSPNRSRP